MTTKRKINPTSKSRHTSIRQSRHLSERLEQIRQLATKDYRMSRNQNSPMPSSDFTAPEAPHTDPNRAVCSYYSEELSTEGKAKRRDLIMFVKYHLIPNVFGPVDTASPLPGWTLFSGPDDYLDDEDFYQDEVVVEEERAGEKEQAGEKGKDKGSGIEEDEEQAGEKGKDKAEEEDGEVLHRRRVPRTFEKRHDRRSLLRVLQKVMTKPKRAASAAEQRALQVREDAGEGGEAQAMPILKNRGGARPSDPAMNMAQFAGPLMRQDLFRGHSPSSLPQTRRPCHKPAMLGHSPSSLPSLPQTGHAAPDYTTLSTDAFRRAFEFSRDLERLQHERRRLQDEMAAQQRVADALLKLGGPWRQ
eukprot:g65885.t1